MMIGAGALLGLLSGVFGVGGSSVATPLLRLLNVPPLIALGTPLPVALPAAIVGGWTYWRRGMVNVRVALLTALGGVPADVVGSYLSGRVPGRVLMALTGLFVVCVGIRLLWKPVVSKSDKSAESPHDASREKLTAAPEATENDRPASLKTLLLVGAGVGFLSGLLANGGGFLLVPAYLLLFSMSAQEAAATSLVAVALLALPGTWVHWRLGHIALRLALLLVVGVVPATYLGARIGLALDARRARLLFGWFLLAFGLLFLIRTLYRAHLYGWLT